MSKNTDFFTKYFDIIFAITTRHWTFSNILFFWKKQTWYAFSKNLKENSQCASMLTFLSKTFQKIMNKQISENFRIFKCGFRERLNAQKFLLPMFEIWKQVVKKFEVIRALLKNLSNLLIAKPPFYRISLTSFV